MFLLKVVDNSPTFRALFVRILSNKNRKSSNANSNMKLVKRNQKLHNPDSPLLIGDVKDDDVVMEVNEPSYIDTQSRLF